VVSGYEPMRGQGEAEQRFTRRVRAFREALGLSAQALADRLAEQGFPEVNRRVLSKIEVGDRRVTLDEAVALCKVFDVSIADMVSPEPVRFEIRAEVTL
jgi:transcriptional regulator with XRE-family HTH domain